MNVVRLRLYFINQKERKKMITIEAQEKYLSFKGDQYYALDLINSLRESYGSRDMPKMLNDFVFNLEVALQNAGVLDENFNLIEEEV